MQKLTLCLLALFMMGCTNIQQQPIYTDDNYAISGYDVVAYFTESAAVKGSTDFISEYQGTQWLFASQQNQALFEQAPQQYIPQYGGYCAYAMSSGFVVSTDPQAFTVFEDKLYLNYSLSVRQNWLIDKAKYISEADQHWLDKNQ